MRRVYVPGIDAARVFAEEEPGKCACSVAALALRARGATRQRAVDMRCCAARRAARARAMRVPRYAPLRACRQRASCRLCASAPIDDITIFSRHFSSPG